MGGSVGLKGTDGVAAEAARLGAVRHSGERAAIALLSARYAPGRDGSGEISQAWDRFLMVEIEVVSMTGKRSSVSLVS